jgi:hypothetical protein
VFSYSLEFVDQFMYDVVFVRLKLLQPLRNGRTSAMPTL